MVQRPLRFGGLPLVCAALQQVTRMPQDNRMKQSLTTSSTVYRFVAVFMLAGLLSIGIVITGLLLGQGNISSSRSNAPLIRQAVELKAERLAHGLSSLNDAQAFNGLSKSSIRSLEPAELQKLHKKLMLTASLEGAELLWVLDADSAELLVAADQVPLLNRQQADNRFIFSKAVLPSELLKNNMTRGIGYIVLNQKLFVAATRLLNVDEGGKRLAVLAAARVERILASDVALQSLGPLVITWGAGNSSRTVAAVSSSVDSKVASSIQAQPDLVLADWVVSPVSNDPTLSVFSFAPMQDPVTQLFAGAVSEVALAAGLGLITCALIGWWWGRKISAPLLSIQSGLKRVAEGDLKPISGFSANSEIRVLAESFNLMVEGMKQREKGMLNVAYRDPLTQLPNRTLLTTRLQEALLKFRTGSKGVSLVLTDLDNLGLIGESFGQIAGDEMLKESTVRVKQVLRNADSLLRVEALNTKDGSLTIARLGGGLFCILLQNCDSEQARKVALRLRDALEKPMQYRGQLVEAKTRIGIASFPDSAADAVGLMACANAALAKSKVVQGGIAVFDPAAEAQREQQLSLLTDLKKSLDRNELLLVFQPRVSLLETAPLMVEALLRWEHPERGLINPNDFLPFAEKTGFITHITRWVIDQSLKQANQWSTDKLPVEMSVNVSLRDLSDKDFPTYVVSRLREHRVAAKHLTLEVPDRVLQAHYERIAPQLSILMGVGVRIAVDDFGAGFASLQYLKELKVSSAKIDRTYVNDLSNDSSRVILVQSVIALCHSMGISVVAQGVEDTATMAVLRKLKCEFAQGYHFGKPLKAAEYKRWVQHQSEKFQNDGTTAVSELS